MAETEILSATNLQAASNTCASCLTSETTGLNQSANGNFGTHLEESLKEITATSNGKVLPIDGKGLPHAILPKSLSNLKSELHSIVNDIQIADVDANQLIESFKGIYQEGINTNSISLDDEINILPDAELAIQEFLDLSNIPELSTSIESLSSGLQNTNEIENQIIDELNIIPIPVAQENSASNKPVQIENLNTTVGVIGNQRILTSVSPPSVAKIQQSQNNSSTLESEELTALSGIQKLDVSENISDKLNDFIAKYLSENNTSRNASKNQPISTEIFQQNFNSIKSDPVIQNVNINAAIDSYGNLNAGALQSKLIESPIPLSIKLGTGSEQIQQSVDQSITQNVKWLIGNKAQNAKINVFPEALGQVNIALSLEDSNLKLNFIATNTVTKELIEASMSSLRSHFGESGINLQEVHVETRSSNEAEQGSQYSDLDDKSQSDFNNGFDETDDEVGEVVPHVYVNNSAPRYLLDAYV
ncbi:MAG: hypothetical protein GKR92_01320 [Gammaproteobacteria bacterium]|nr:MAG: hypothetical protein GKR92_01320 [Gammaproteobacteria bacterium]